MTTDKACKRAVRSRMTKTGESYTAARRHVRSTTTEPEVAPLPPRVAEPDTSEAAVLAATGRTWDDWFRTLDAADATSMTHTDIARWVAAEFPISGWWAQNVTVGYERARGMRAVNQRTDGFYVAVNKTIAVPAEVAFAAIVDPDRRAMWLEADLLRLRASTAPRSATFDVRGETSRVAAYLTAKGTDRVTVTIEHNRLASADDVVARRAFWRERLASLATSLV
jgi:hypothetical protein